VQKILYTPGSAISSGTAVAEWADLSEMRAVIKVPEWEAAEVQVGQSAEILLGTERFPFQVARIDPAVADGVIGVELVALGSLPPTARINASVEGRILIKQLDDTLSITRPARLGRTSETVALYRFDEASKLATRVDVRFGARSSSHAQVVDGLSEGSWVILTDLAAADSAAEIRLQ
jgi:HlyD family secretion protein